MTNLQTLNLQIKEDFTKWSNLFKLHFPMGTQKIYRNPERAFNLITQHDSRVIDAWFYKKSDPALFNKLMLKADKLNEILKRYYTGYETRVILALEEVMLVDEYKDLFRSVGKIVKKPKP